MAKKKTVQDTEKGIVSNVPPFVFISHDSRDAELAKAFGELLKKASLGFLKYFCSSDRNGKEGLEYGTEWYPTITNKIRQASDVVCLLTERSADRPWLLYEAGMAKGMNESTVFGLVMGNDMDTTIKGPFAQFQNCKDDKTGLVNLVKQLVGRVPNAEPDDEIIENLVDAFLKQEKSILKALKSSTKKENTTQKEIVDSNSSTKLFEEVKLMFRDLSDRISREAMYKRKNGMFEAPRMFMERIRFFEKMSPRLAVRCGLNVYKDFMPWIYDEGCYLLDLLLTQHDNPRDIMMQWQDLLMNSQRIAMNEFEGFREYAWINDFILSAVNHLVHEKERKIKK